MKSTIIAATLIISMNGALAQSGRTTSSSEMDLLDVALSGQQYDGQKLRMKGCNLYRSKISGSATCAIQRRGADVGYVEIQLQKADVRGIRQAVEQCAGLSPDEKRCRVSLSGEVAVVNGKATLRDVVVSW